MSGFQMVSDFHIIYFNMAVKENNELHNVEIFVWNFENLYQVEDVIGGYHRDPEVLAVTSIPELSSDSDFQFRLSITDLLQLLIRNKNQHNIKMKHKNHLTRNHQIGVTSIEFVFRFITSLVNN